MAFRFLVFALTAILVLMTFSSSVLGQVPSMPCTSSMMTSFSPCMNFVTNSSQNGTITPTSDCCNSLKSLMGNGKDCLCLIATGSVPFQIPINRTLVASLPGACKMPGVPLQCKVSGAPAPAPGPMTDGSSFSPDASSPSPSAGAGELAPPEPLSPPTVPLGNTTPNPPAQTTTNGGGSTPSNRAGVTPSGAERSYTVSPMYFAAVLGAVIALKYY